MPIKTFKPVTPSLRFRTVSTFEEITCATPDKSLLVPLKKKEAGTTKGGLPADTGVEELKGI